MTIGHVASQNTGFRTDNATSASQAYPASVTAGSLLVIVACKYSPSIDAFVAGDCTKSAGTATLGAISFDSSVNYNHTGSEYIAVGVWSCIVTAGGSCTMQVGGGVAGSYWILGVDEYTGSWDGTRAETSNSSSAASGAPTTGNVTTAGAAVIVGGINTAATTNTAHTQDANFTLIYEMEDGVNHNTGSIGFRIVTTGTTDDYNLTAPTAYQSTGAVVAYREAGGGGGGGTFAGEIFPARRNRPGRGPYSVGRYFRPNLGGSYVNATVAGGGVIGTSPNRILLCGVGR